MSLPRKQNRNEDDRLLAPTEAVEFSRLSARMVELSLQRSHGDSILADALPVKVNSVSSPLPWPSTAPPHLLQPQGTPSESGPAKYWKEIWRSPDDWLANARVSSAAAVRKFCEHARSTQRKLAVWNSKSRVEITSRLWASTGVAPLAAALVFVWISGVPHDAHSRQAAEYSGGNTSPVTPAIENTSKPQSSSTLDTKRAAAPVRHPRSPAMGESRIRKIRLRKDDDYVAPDTYVYYGNKGKPVK